MDAQRLKDNFAWVVMHGDEVALCFYSDLFLRNPDIRELFPVAMTAQRELLLGALGRIVADVDDAGRRVPYLQALGREHRKFGALAAHYEVVGVSLLATLAHFSGPEWAGDLAASSNSADELCARVVTDAASEDAASNTPWWDATVLHHELRSSGIAVFRVSTPRRLAFEPGLLTLFGYGNIVRRELAGNSPGTTTDSSTTSSEHDIHQNQTVITRL